MKNIALRDLYGFTTIGDLSIRCLSALWVPLYDLVAHMRSHSVTHMLVGVLAVACGAVGVVHSVVHRHQSGWWLGATVLGV